MDQLSRRAAFLSAGLAMLPAAAMAQAPRGGMMAFGSAEVQHANNTGAVGAVALQTSRLALDKASDAKVRSFAQSEVMEQETISRILMEHAQSLGQRLPPPTPDPRMAPMIAALQRAPRGAAFDREYVRGQIQGHETLLRIQEDYLRSPQNMHQKHVAMLARGQIMDHLKALRDMEGQLRNPSR